MVKSMFKAFATVTLISVVTRFAAFLFKIYLSRRLGAEMLGVYQITMSVFMLFVGLVASGIPTTLSRKTAEYDAAKNFSKSNSIFSMSLIISVSLSLMVCLFFVLFPNILTLLFADKRCISLFITILPSLLSTAVYCTTRAWFWGKGDFGIYSGAELFEEVFKIAITATIISLPIMRGNIVGGVATAYVIGDFVAAGVVLLLFAFKKGKMPRPKYFAEVSRSAAPLTGARIYGSVLSSVAALILPILLIGNGFSTGDATAEFGRISGMVMPLIMTPITIIGSLAVVIVPELARNHGNNALINRQITRANVFATYVAAVFFVIFFASGEDLGNMLYGDMRSGVLLSLSAFLSIPLSLSQLSSTILNSLGKENWTFIVNIISSLFLLCLLFLLPQFIGIMAYPIALIVHHCVGLTLNTIKLRKHTRIKLNYLVYEIMIVLTAVIAALIGKAVGDSLWQLHYLWRMAVAVLVGVAIFSLSLIPLVINAVNKSMKKRTNGTHASDKVVISSSNSDVKLTKNRH